MLNQILSIKDKKGIQFCFEVLRYQSPNLAKIRDQFNTCLSSVQEQYQLISLVNKYEAILRDFPFICMAQLDICRYLTRKYNKKLSQIDAAKKLLFPYASSTDPTGVIASKDKVLEGLYEQYLKSWTLIDRYKDSCPEVFTFGFMCQQDIDMTDYEARVRFKDKACVLDFLLVTVDKESLEGKRYIFMKTILRTLCEKVQNKLVTLIRKELGYIDELEKLNYIRNNKSTKANKKGLGHIDESEKLKYLRGNEYTKANRKKGTNRIILNIAQEADFITLDFSIDQLIRQNVSVDVITPGNDEFLIDYPVIQHKLAEIMVKPEITAEDDELSTFEFNDGIIKAQLTDIQNYFSFIKVSEWNGDIKKYLDTQAKNEDPERSRKIFILIIKICDFLQSQIQYQDMVTPVLEIVANAQKSNELRDEILNEAKMYSFPDTVKILNLKQMMETLRDKDIDVFIDNYCNDKLQEKDESELLELTDEAKKTVTLENTIDTMDKPELLELTDEAKKDVTLKDLLQTLDKLIEKEIKEVIYPDSFKLSNVTIGSLSEHNLDEFSDKHAMFLQGLSVSCFNKIREIINHLKY